MIETILISLFFGFGIYTVLYFALKSFLSDRARIKIEEFDNTACLIIAWSGIVYLILWLLNLYFQHNNVSDISELYRTNNRLIGPYWMVYLIQPSLFLSSQLLWFKKIRKSIVIRITVALMLMISIEGMVIFLTSLHRDYVPVSWGLTLKDSLIDWLINIGVFSVISILIHILKIKFISKKQFNSK